MIHLCLEFETTSFNGRILREESRLQRRLQRKLTGFEFQYAAWTRVEGHLKQRDKIYSHGNMKNYLYIQGSKISLVLLIKSGYCCRGSVGKGDTCASKRECTTYGKGKKV